MTIQMIGMQTNSRPVRLPINATIGSGSLVGVQFRFEGFEFLLDLAFALQYRKLGGDTATTDGVSLDPAFHLVDPALVMFEAVDHLVNVAVVQLAADRLPRTRGAV